PLPPAPVLSPLSLRDALPISFHFYRLALVVVFLVGAQGIVKLIARGVDLVGVLFANLVLSDAFCLVQVLVELAVLCSLGCLVLCLIKNTHEKFSLIQTSLCAQSLAPRTIPHDKQSCGISP